jgi:proline-rich protein PRCC
MDLLGGYGSDSGSEPDSPKAPAAATALISAAPPPRTLPTAPLTSASERVETGVSTLSDLPAPASARAPLFSGLPMPAFRRKRITAKFSCPIDYGGAPTSTGGINEDDDDDDLEPAVKRMKRSGTGGGNKGMSIADFLPAPKNTKGPPAGEFGNNEKALGNGGGGGGGGDGKMAYEDDDLVPGAEDLTGMYLGKGDGEPADEGGDILEQQPPMLGAAAPTTQPQHIRGVYDGQEYIYDTATGQYYYPDPEYNLSNEPTTTNHNINNTSYNATDVGGLPGGIQFKEISGAQLRHMDPGQRAELNALRSALGDDYESKLKSEAAKVGAVSKLAKRKHQLSSLYVQAKEQELEDMEKRSSGAKTKAETQRKYGW